MEISDFLDFQVPDISNLARAHPRPKPGPTQARFEISGNLEIQKFEIPWNPCDKDFRILDLLEPLRQRFQNFGPTGTLASKISRFPDADDDDGRALRSQPDPSPNAPRDQIRRKGPCCDVLTRHDKQHLEHVTSKTLGPNS